MLITFEQMKNHYNMNITGILHVGGHWGEESSSYNALGIKNVIFFEPLKRSYDVCKQNVEQYGYRVINTALGTEEKTVEMYTETKNQGQSSSILKPLLHVQQYPDIVFDGKELVEMTTLDSFMETVPEEFNFINMDVQGYELMVLKGSTKTLENIDYIYCEVNRAELYEECAQIEELDEYLKTCGFVRELTNWAGGTWGDALYIRSKQND